MTKNADSATLSLIAALLVGIVPHIIIIPWWINIWCFSLWGYLFFAYRFSWKLPSKIIRSCLTFIAFMLILFSMGRTFNNESGIGLLCLMASLKPFEINSLRDRMITIFLAYFMVISGLFFSTSIPMTGYMIVSVVIITGLLIRINHPEEPFWRTMKLSAGITAQAVPLMLILFFVFPRLQGSLWGVQKRASAVSGFSTTLTLGTVSRIVKNNAVAFRVEFKSEQPLYNELYWRGIVLRRLPGRSGKRSNIFHGSPGRFPAAERSPIPALLIPGSPNGFLSLICP